MEFILKFFTSFLSFKVLCFPIVYILYLISAHMREGKSQSILTYYCVLILILVITIFFVGRFFKKDIEPYY